MSRRGERLALLGILVLAAALRLPALGRIPNGLIPDEALSAYDAFSIGKTGRDGTTADRAFAAPRGDNDREHPAARRPRQLRAALHDDRPQRAMSARFSLHAPFRPNTIPTRDRRRAGPE